MKGILPSSAFRVLLNTLVNPKISLYIQRDSPDKTSRRASLPGAPYDNMPNGTHHRIHRRRSHASEGE